MDVRFTDSVATPRDMAPYFSETLVPLPAGFLAYRPLKSSSIDSGPPCSTSGRVTFGAFHNLAKISDTALRLWVSILREVQIANLKLKLSPLSIFRCDKSLRLVVRAQE